MLLYLIMIHPEGQQSHEPSLDESARLIARITRAFQPGYELAVRENALSPTDNSKEVAPREPLTVVRTESGLTVAMVQPWEFAVNTRDTRTTNSLTLIVLSVVGGDTLTFESHIKQWNEGYSGERVLVATCGHVCKRFTVQGNEAMTHYFFDSVTPFQQSQEEFFKDLKVSAYEDSFNSIRNRRPDEDVFSPANSLAKKRAWTVLEDHDLISPAAREAFGVHLPPGLPRRG